MAQLDAVTCKFCGGHKMTCVLDLGHVALAGAFVKPDEFADEKKYPLEIFFCEQCCILQVGQSVEPETLFKKYFYFSSAIKTLQDHFTEYAKMLKKRFLAEPTASILEIGCNDGVLLKPLADLGVKKVLGVDPATTVVKTINDKRLHIINDFFSNRLAATIVKERGAVDAVTCNNAYAHLENINDITAGIKTVMKPTGVFVFEVHYLGNLIEQRQYDMIYHEHLYYYSLMGLENHFAHFKMQIFDYEFVANHAGSIRVFVQNLDGGVQPVSPKVRGLHDVEMAKGYDQAQTFLNYGHAIAETKAELMTVLKAFKAEGKRIWGYGASGRANTIIQYCGINADLIDLILDDAPAKNEMHTPGSHILISSRAAAPPKWPDIILVFAWSFISEITPKLSAFSNAGGKMVVPLPEVKII